MKEPEIHGYRNLTPGEIDGINEIKQAEVAVGSLWHSVSAIEGVDQERMMKAAEYLEIGFMQFVRAIARPESRF